MQAEQIHQFWFHEIERKRWFNPSSEFDQQIHDRFALVWQVARDGELNSWSATPVGALSLVIVLDQFPRNMHRGQTLAFSSDAQALEVASQAIRQGFDAHVSDDEKSFFYLPFMHSEDMADQDKSVELFAAANLQNSLPWAEQHRQIIRQFGRFPHRNSILGRQSSAEELAWLTSDDAFHG